MNEGKFLCLKSWSALCQPKAFGALGFRRMEDMNKALLAKLGWKVLAEPESRWNVSKQGTVKVDVSSLFLHDKMIIGDGRIYLLQEICSEKGCCFIIGDGSKVDFWKPLIPWNEGFTVKPKLNIEVSQPILVNSLLNSESEGWNVDSVSSIFDEQTAESILIHWNRRGIEDKFIWLGNKKGKLSIKTTYLLDQDDRFDKSNCQILRNCGS